MLTVWVRIPGRLPLNIMPKVVAISDTHGEHKRLVIPKCDILIHAGDSTWQGAYRETQDFLYWLKDQPAKHKLLIAGNHELTLDKHHDKFNPHIRDMVTSQDGFIYLENEEVVIDGLKFYGTPWTPWFHNWAFNARPDADVPFHPGARGLTEVYSGIPEDVNVIICHGPAYDMCDRSNRGDERTGSMEMRHITSQLDHLRLYICGHIHEARGMKSADGGVYYCNVSSLDRDYETINPPIVFQLDKNGFIDSVEGYEE